LGEQQRVIAQQSAIGPLGLQHQVNEGIIDGPAAQEPNKGLAIGAFLYSHLDG
jgi:hypothetical protein